MAKELSKDVLNRLARLGARARLEELEKERREILRAFPGLDEARKGVAAAETEPPAREGKAKREPRKRKVSAAARKAASERMKQYWENKRRAGTS